MACVAVVGRPATLGDAIVRRPEAGDARSDGLRPACVSMACWCGRGTYTFARFDAPSPFLSTGHPMREWFRNLFTAVGTVLQGMLVTLRVFGSTYDPKRRTFTEHFEYPELPAPVAARYRGFHRYDLTTCIACDQCAKACPVDCIYIGKERVENGKGFRVSGFTIDYSKCMFCALCVEPCPVDCIFMGSTLDLSCYSRDGTIVDFARLPVDVAWGRASLNPTAVAASKVIVEPVHGGPNQ
jgi:NADH-quinone oxidoreductase subunit I